MTPSDPNFPSGLDIKPSILIGREGLDDRFNEESQTRAIETYGIAGRVWEASYAMLAYLDRHRPSHYDPGDIEFDPPPFTEIIHVTRGHSLASRDDEGLVIIELGSGTGLIAARLAPCLREGKDLFVATDLPEVCDLLRKNLEDQSTVLEVHPLTWANHLDALAIATTLRLGTERHLTHIICSDLVYFPFLLAPLLRTLLHLTSEPIVPGSGVQPTVIISYKIRSLAKETPFWAAFGLWFVFSPVLARRPKRQPSRDDSSGNESSWVRFSTALEQEDSFVFVAQRRPESRTWTVPEKDDDLLDGVGAWGNQERKSDDTFETMLLMSLDITED